MFKKAILSTALLALSSSGLGAAIITDSAVVPNTAAAFSTIVNLDRFDTTLGTLQQVRILLSATSSADVTVGNFNGTPQPYTGATTQATMSVTGPESIVVSFILAAGPFSGTAPALSLTTVGSANDSDSAFTIVPVINWGSYTGVGPATAAFTVGASNLFSTGTGPGGVTFGGALSAGGTVTVEYTYESFVPEPGTYAMLGGGLALIGLIGRRRRAQ